MQKLLATGKTDLLPFVSARTKRGFSAFLVRQPDGKIGFEFEAKVAGKGGARRSRAPVALRVLGAHPRDKKPVELHAGRYGPYVKHGDTNATLPDRDKAESVTLDEALALLAEKEGKQGSSGATGAARRAAAAKARAPVSEPETARRATTTKRAPMPTAANPRSKREIPWQAPARAAAEHALRSRPDRASKRAQGVEEKRVPDGRQKGSTANG